MAANLSGCEAGVVVSTISNGAAVVWRNVTATLVFGREWNGGNGSSQGEEQSSELHLA